MRKFSSFLPEIGLCLFLLPAAFAASELSVTVTAHDGSPAIRPSASLHGDNATAAPTATGPTFVFRDLAPGKYRLELTASGAQRYIVSAIEVGAADKLQLKVKMQPGPDSKSTEITAPVLQLLTSGDAALDQGDFAKAAEIYQNAIDQAPSFAEARFQHGLCMIRLSRYPDALADLNRAYALNPDREDAAAKVGEIYILAYTTDSPNNRGRYLNEIRGIATRLLDHNPQSYDGIRLDAFLLANSGNTNAAIDRYRQAIGVRPNLPETVIPLASLLLQSGNNSEAETLLTSLIKAKPDAAAAYDSLYQFYQRQKRPADAERILKAKAAAMPDHLEYRIQLAAHYFSLHDEAAASRELNSISTAGSNGAGHLLVGDFRSGVQQFAAAQQEYESGLQLGGKSRTTFLLRLAQLNAMQQKNAEAARLLDEALRVEPNNSEATGMRAALWVNSGDAAKIDAAIPIFKQLLERTPSNFTLHYELGRAYLAKAEKSKDAAFVDLATAELNSALALKRDFALAHLVLAQINIRKGDFAGALNHAETVLQFQQAPNPQARLLQAIAWIGQKDFAKAIPALEALLKDDPAQIDVRYQLAEAYLSQRDYPKAEAAFRDFRRLSPNDPRGLTGLTQTLQDAKRYPEAVALLKEELAAHPSNSFARFKLIETYKLDGQLDAAIAECRQAIALKPDSSDLYANLGDILRLKHDMPGAIENFRKAVALNPNSAGPMTALGMILEEAGKLPEARSLYEKILALEPNNIVALNNLAFQKSEDGSDLDGALALARKAHQLAPGVDNITDTLGCILIKKKLASEAVDLFAELAGRNPSVVSNHFHLAEAYLLQGDRAKARQECETALSQLNARPENARYETQIRDLLNKL